LPLRVTQPAADSIHDAAMATLLPRIFRWRQNPAPFANRTV